MTPEKSSILFLVYKNTQPIHYNPGKKCGHLLWPSLGNTLPLSYWVKGKKVTVVTNTKPSFRHIWKMEWTLGYHIFKKTKWGSSKFSETKMIDCIDVYMVWGVNTWLEDRELGWKSQQSHWPWVLPGWSFSFSGSVPFRIERICLGNSWNFLWA